MHDFDAAGVALYALSYDEPEALADFANAHKIGYHLLPDPQSQVIRDFGILNTLIDPTDHPWYGIPYPGTYIIDAQGTITHKFFDNNLAVRAGPEQLLRAVRGEAQPSLPPATEAAPTEVQLDISLDGNALVSTVQRDLVIRFQVPAGRHVYAEPAPQGSVAVDVTLDANDLLVQRPLLRPGGTNHQLAGTDEVFVVHDGFFELRLPLTVCGKPKEGADLQITGEVRWQCCDDEVCDIPTSQRFDLQVPVDDAPPVAMGNAVGAALEPNAMAHFQRMSERRKGSN